MSFIPRKAARVLLLNSKNELLLMCIEDFDISTPEGKRNERFWCTIGGGIESDETIEQAALREIYEETSITQDAITLGPVVWYGEVDLILKGIPTRLQESFIVAKTSNHEVFLHQPTHDEKQVVKKLQWFSLEDIESSPDTIFPILLPKYLPAVLSGSYPEKAIEINLKA